jgi:hypothetical protein
MFPKRFAIEEATSIDAAAMILVVKNIDPSIPSRRLNFDLKNQTTQELAIISKLCEVAWEITYRGARPDAKASRANKMQRLKTITRLSLLISGNIDSNFDLFFFGSSSSASSASSGAVSGSATGDAFFSASHALLSAIARQSLISPMAAYPQNTARYAAMSFQPKFPVM